MLIIVVRPIVSLILPDHFPSPISCLAAEQMLEEKCYDNGSSMFF